MRKVLAGHFSLALCLMACGPESSTPTSVETAPPTLRAAAQPAFGVSVGFRLARATAIEGFACSMGPAGVTVDSRIVISSSGNATLVCRLRTAGGPKPALIVKDELCGIAGALTTELHFVWTPSGKATLVCHLKK